MSRIGKAPINVPDGVDVKIDGTTVTIKGKVGEQSRTLPSTMKIDLSDGVITVSRPNDEPEQRALHGLTRSLLNNMVIGVSDGFSKRLELIGTGYRVQQKGKELEITDSKLYNLIDTEVYAPHLLELEIQGAGFEGFAFTFG